MLTAADIMTTNVITVSPETTVREVAQLLLRHRISGVPVVDGQGRLVGIVSEGDLIGHSEFKDEQRRSWWLSIFDTGMSARGYARTHAHSASEVMTTSVVTVADDASLPEIAKTLEKRRIKRVPVLRDGKLVGIVTRSNLLQALATVDVSTPVKLDDRAIRERLLAELQAQPWAPRLMNVTVENGVVHLFGFVQNDDERLAIRVAAEGIPGVVKVEDHTSIQRLNWSS